MVCERCNKNPATVHTVRVHNGVKTEQYLCAECAGGMEMQIPSFMEILSGFPYIARTKESEACVCGLTFHAFQKTGLVGCNKCYTTFRSQLSPVIKRAQGGRLVHVGRRPEASGNARVGEKNVSKMAAKAAEPCVDECARLMEELQAAVKEERYERAAELRDRIRSLKGGDAS